MYTLQELASLRMAYKRNNDSKLNKEELKEQFASGDYKAVKVQLYNTEVNSYQELWKVVGEDKYYSRYIFGKPIWYYVADPLGYAELDRTCPDNIIFIICDMNGNELFGTSNLHGAEFPTFDEACINEWNRIKEAYPHCKDNKEKDFWSQWAGNGTTIGADKWLLTFKDPSIYGDDARDYDENWIYHKVLVSREPLSGFNYLGIKLCIFKEIWEQRTCKKQVVNYCIREMREDSNITPKEYGYYKFLDSWFEGESGTMYLKAEAIKVMSDALKKIYNNENISKIYNSCGYSYERFISYIDAAEFLLNKNWNKESVKAKIKAEKCKHSFYKVDDPNFPDVHERDSKYNYDVFGRRI